ncbi:MAG: beta-propeller fold lactonase family protein [Solirubrobacterales bacterium]
MAGAASAQAAPYAYVANADGSDPSNVSQFTLGTGGLLAALSPPTVAAGSGPDDVAVSPDGESVYVTNDADGSVSQYDVSAGGTLSPKTPNAVGGAQGPGLAMRPNGKQLYVANFSTDRTGDNITVYNVGTGGALSLRGYAKTFGQDPHGVAASPDGKSLYVAQCCQGHGIAQFDIPPDGGLRPKTPANVAIGGLAAAGVVVSPNGKNVYVTSYVGSTIYQFNVGAGGKLSPKSPASVQSAAGSTAGIAVSPDGKSVFVANTGVPDPGSVSQFNVGAGGKLSPKSPAKVTTGGQDAEGIALSPDGKSAYVTNTSSDNIAQFDIGAGGKLSQKSPATVAAGSAPIGIAVNPIGGPASVSASGKTLVVTAGIGNKDNLVVTRPLPGSLRVTNLASGPFTGSAVMAGAGCTQVDGQTAKCNVNGVNLIRVSAGNEADKVTNSTGIKSSLFGEKGADTLIGGKSADTLTGGSDADTLIGKNGNDQLLARDMTSDTAINCDGGNAPGSADKADLDLLPNDPNSVVTGCETKVRH